MPAMPASEVKRGQDACKAYVDKVCACAETVPAMKQPCELAHALPDAIQVGLDVAASPDVDAARRRCRPTPACARSSRSASRTARRSCRAAGCP